MSSKRGLIRKIKHRTMMLGNLLGNIDALLSDHMEDSLSKLHINYMSNTVQVNDGNGQDTRKGTDYSSYFIVTFSEAVMEKTISARTSTTVGTHLLLRNRHEQRDL